VAEDTVAQSGLQKWIWWIVGGIVGGVLILAALFGFGAWLGFRDWQQSGVFGDTFGALNAVFSGLAMGGLVLAILLQREELKTQREELRLQREELKLTRKELSRSAAAQEGQSDILIKTALIHGFSTVHQQLRTSDDYETGQFAQTLGDKLVGMLQDLEASIDVD